MGSHTNSNTALDLNEQIDFSKRSALKASIVWGLAAIFYFYELMLLVSPSVMYDNLAEAFNTSAEQLGNLAAFYYYAYASIQIPVGLFMDRFGPKILLTFACLMCAIGCVIFGSAKVLLVAELGRFVMGIGGAFAVVGCLKLASIWFAVNRFALLTGVMVAVGMMGGVFGQAPVAKLVMSVGWQNTMYLGAALGLVLGAIIWLVVSDHPVKPLTLYKINKGKLAPLSEDLLIWGKLFSLVGVLCLPIIICNFKNYLTISHALVINILFYAGWLAALAIKYTTKRARPIQMSFLAASFLVLLTIWLLTNYQLSVISYGMLSFVLGLAARHLFNDELPIPYGLRQVMKNPQVWVASLYAGLMFVPTTGFGQLWGVPYFSEKFSLEKDSAGFLVSMIFFGWAIGGPFYGWFSDRIQKRKLPMAFAAFTAFLVMMAIVFVPISINQAKLLMFLLGMFSSGFILAFSIVREINLPIFTGTAIGFINTLNNASGALAQPIIGKLLDLQLTNNLAENAQPVYTLEMFQEALLFLPVCLLIAFFLLPLIKETNCKPTVTRLDN